MKTIITVALTGISSLAFCQETQKADSTTTQITINETPIKFDANNAPLYILNNKEIAYEDLSKIDTDKISAISVLKDSKATEKYGDKGRRGVVIIELKDDTRRPAHKKRSTIE